MSDELDRDVRHAVSIKSTKALRSRRGRTDESRTVARSIRAGVSDGGGCGHGRVRVVGTPGTCRGRGAAGPPSQGQRLRAAHALGDAADAGAVHLRGPAML